LLIFENRTPGRIFEHKTEKVTPEKNKELNNFFLWHLELCEQIKVDEIGWACYTCGRVQKCVKVCVAILRNANNKIKNKSLDLGC